MRIATGYMNIQYLVSFYAPETQRKKSDRVLVFSELGISRGATVIIAYLMKRQKWSLKVFS